MKVGILGGGQLGRMLALAGMPIGIRCRILDPSPDAPAAQIASHIVGDYRDGFALDRLADGIDVITWEFENVPVEAVERLASRATIRPHPDALRTGQDRLNEKQCFERLGIATPRYRAVASLEELRSAVEAIGLPAVLKSRRMGYDGKGQRVLQRPEDAEPAWAAIGAEALVLEEFIAFDRELSILTVRGIDGSVVFYPLVENLHRDGILRLSRAPAPQLSPSLQRQAEDLARAVLEELNYVGVLAIELFQQGERLLANEMAPRVHNSGHWTIEGAATSQFENHLRAVAGWPLGSTDPIGHSAMINLIGTLPPPPLILEVPDTHLHLYAKSPRPNRKVGHVTTRAIDVETLEKRVSALAGRLSVDLGR